MLFQSGDGCIQAPLFCVQVLKCFRDVHFPARISYGKPISNRKSSIS